MTLTDGPNGGPTRQLARFVSELRYEDLPAEAVAVLKMLCLDTVGTALAGTTLGPGCNEVARVVRDAGGAPECTVMGYGVKVPALTAAFANGATAHALNYDALGGEGGHLGVSTLPAPLAAAERRGSVSGKELLAAMGVAAEVTARLAGALFRANVKANETFLEGQLLGYFGAAAGASRVMGLSVQDTHSALGAALMQAGGTMQVVFDGDPPAKAIYGGFANLGGMLAALLAQQGVGAEVRVIDGPAGLYGMFYHGTYDHGAIIDGLGEDFDLLKARFKPWPTSGIVHPFIEAACTLAQQHRLGADDIASVTVRSNDHFMNWVEPQAERQRPPNAASAANSVQFAVGKAFAHQAVGLADFTAEGLEDPEALAIAALTGYEVVESMRGLTGQVEVTTRAGDVLSETVPVPLGHPSRPLSLDQIVAKLRDCASHSAHPIQADALEQLVERVDRLEDLEDVRVLADLVRGD